MTVVMSPIQQPEWIGTYRVLRKLGEGGMAVVYEALHEAIHRHVALKLLNCECAQNADLLSRFFDEARACNLIEHSSIVQVWDVGRHIDGRAYIVMELLKGESLSQRLHRLGGRMPMTLAVPLFRQIAEGLSAAHRSGIVHRDLKPENIMIVPDSEVPGKERCKILDFGIAKMSQRGKAKTARNLVIGTPRYMSPEQCRCAADATAKSDSYSLGVMLYEALAGRPPYDDGKAIVLMAQHMNEEAPSLSRFVPELPKALTDLVHQLLRKQSSARPGMQEVAQALDVLDKNSPSYNRIGPDGHTVPSSGPVASPTAVTWVAEISARHRSTTKAKKAKATFWFIISGTCLMLAAVLLTWDTLPTRRDKLEPASASAGSLDPSDLICTGVMGEVSPMCEPFATEADPAAVLACIPERLGLQKPKMESVAPLSRPKKRILSQKQKHPRRKEAHLPSHRAAVPKSTAPSPSTPPPPLTDQSQLSVPVSPNQEEDFHLVD